MILVRPSLNPLNHLILWLFWVRGATSFKVYAHYTCHLFQQIYHERCVGLSMYPPSTSTLWNEGWAFMKHLRYCPLHVTEFCGEMPRETNNWRLWWKKGARFFTQNWTLSKTLQISHAVLFRCVKQCSVCFFAEVFFVYKILRMQKSLYLWSYQHVTRKTVISLIIQQNIDLLQCVTLKSVDFRVKPLQFWFRVNVRPQRR